MTNVRVVRTACYSSPGRRKCLVFQPLQLLLPAPESAFFSDFLLGQPNRRAPSHACDQRNLTHALQPKSSLTPPVHLSCGLLGLCKEGYLTISLCLLLWAKGGFTVIMSFHMTNIRKEVLNTECVQNFLPHF